MKIEGAKILITGGAKRIGRQCALTLASLGARVLIHYNRSAADAMRVRRDIEQCGGNAGIFRADLSGVAQVRRLVAEAWNAWDGIDVLINNASVFLRTPAETVSESQWDRIFNTNVKGPFFLAREVGIRMRRRGHGKIINIADWSGERPYKNYLPYCMSKAAVIAMTKGLAKAFSPLVQVNAISPGPVLLPAGISAKDTKEILRGTPLHRIGSPEDIANTVRFLIEGTDFMTGSIVTVDGGRLIA